MHELKAKLQRRAHANYKLQPSRMHELKHATPNPKCIQYPIAILAYVWIEIAPAATILWDILCCNPCACMNQNSDGCWLQLSAAGYNPRACMNQNNRRQGKNLYKITVAILTHAWIKTMTEPPSKRVAIIAHAWIKIAATTKKRENFHVAILVHAWIKMTSSQPFKRQLQSSRIHELKWAIRRRTYFNPWRCNPRAFMNQNQPKCIREIWTGVAILAHAWIEIKVRNICGNEHGLQSSHMYESKYAVHEPLGSSVTLQSSRMYESK